MFHTDDLSRILVTDRRHRYEQAAGRRRLLHTLRRRSDQATTPVEAAGAARLPISLGRTPSEIARRAA